MGPYYRDRVPIIGTGSLSQSLWVPIRLGDSGKREIVNLYMWGTIIGQLIIGVVAVLCDPPVTSPGFYWLLLGLCRFVPGERGRPQVASLTSAADDLDVGKDAGEIEASGRGLKALLDILYILKSPICPNVSRCECYIVQRPKKW